MRTIELDAPDGTIEAILARPTGTGPWPGVVVIHDGMGFGTDVRNNVEMLADYGYLAIAPNLFSRGRVRCIRSIFRALLVTGQGPPVRDILAARDRLLADPDCTRKTAVIGFCMGGGFALLTAPKGFDAAAPFYPGLYGDYRTILDGACPVVASYAKLDPSLIGAPAKLDRALTELGVEHDIKSYPGTMHGFANVFAVQPLLRVTGLGYDEDAARDAWHRIFAFFDRHLTVEDGAAQTDTT
ncbi:dienelactone hydrolase family protein [Nocardia sp. GCM10030253]|uniref:dienelactone hydrolase family protein n=1 Tax=Nocardia sp. GCM10030253 TaxID=3273404 RepID=UPI0036448AC1